MKDFPIEVKGRSTVVDVDGGMIDRVVGTRRETLWGEGEVAPFVGLGYNVVYGKAWNDGVVGTNFGGGMVIVTVLTFLDGKFGYRIIYFHQSPL